MAQKPDASPPPEVKLHYIDRPDLAETFADSINALFFDGQTLRIEVGVSRVENSKNDEPIMVRRYPACRLVLTPGAAVELINHMEQVTSALSQAGLLKSTQPAAASATTAKS